MSLFYPLNTLKIVAASEKTNSKLTADIVDGFQSNLIAGMVKIGRG